MWNHSPWRRGEFKLAGRGRAFQVMGKLSKSAEPSLKVADKEPSWLALGAQSGIYDQIVEGLKHHLKSLDCHRALGDC